VRRWPLVAICYLLLIVLPACRQEDGTATSSSSGVPKIKFEKYTLPNGLEVILHEDHSTPVVAVNTYYKVGSADEQVGRTGFAHLFEHIMFMGSKNVPYPMFDRLLEAAGANNNGTTDNDRTNYYETLPSNALALALWLDSDRMGFLLPTMDQAKLDAQREVVKGERLQRVENAPYGRGGEVISAALFPKAHPYSWPVIGSMKDLGAATLEDVSSFFKTYYAPNNATLVIAGDFKSDSVKKLVEAYFGDIPRGPDMPARPDPAPFAPPRDTFLVLEDRVQLPQVTYAWHTVKMFHPDDAALDVLSGVLTGGKNSRLYKKLVYDLQIAQEVSAYQAGGRIDGYYQLSFIPAPGQSPAKLDSIVRSELDSLVSHGISDRELARVLNSQRAGFLDRLASVFGKSEVLNIYNYYAGNPDYVQEDAARYAKVTREDVQRVAKTYLGAPKVVLTIVPQGEKKTMLTGGAR
jgi:zinc protease